MIGLRDLAERGTCSSYKTDQTLKDHANVSIVDVIIC